MFDQFPSRREWTGDISASDSIIRFPLLSLPLRCMEPPLNSWDQFLGHREEPRPAALHPYRKVRIPHSLTAPRLRHLHRPEKCSRGSFDDSAGLEAAFDRIRRDKRAGVEDFDFQPDASLQKHQCVHRSYPASLGQDHHRIDVQFRQLLFEILSKVAHG